MKYQWIKNLFLPEALAIGAFIHGGMGFVGSHLDFIQRAVVGALAVIGAGFNGAADTMIGMFHDRMSFLSRFERSLL